MEAIMSPTAKEFGSYLSISLAMAGAQADEIQSSLVPTPENDTFIYSGCLVPDLPPPWMGTKTGVSLYLEQVAYPDQATSERLSKDEVPNFLRNLKRILNLSTTELAEICLVSRPTIYNWHNGSDIGQENLKRLDALRSVLLQWTNRMGEDLFSTPRIPSNQELKDRLQATSIDLESVYRLMSSLAENLTANEVSRPKTARELFAEHGLEKLPEDMQGRSLEQAYIDAGRGR
jgi:transcriptional regulator with XRE-family HTH domain